MKKEKAFTLVELLVVIVVIGLLSSILFVATIGIRGKTRDAKRGIEVVSIGKALEIYFLDNGKYPELNNWTSLEEDADTNSTFSQEMEEFLPVIPRDPLYGQTSAGGEPYSYQYMSSSGGEYWAIKTTYETKGSGGTEEIITVYSSPEGETALGGGGGSLEEQLAEAMDCPELAGLNFSIGGDANWQVDETTFYTEGSSAKSGAISDNQISYWQIKPDKAGTISIRYKTSCGSGDYLKVCSSNGSSFCSNISGVSNWGGNISTSLSPGYTLRVEYIKDGSGSAGQDSVWVDGVNWTPD